MSRSNKDRRNSQLWMQIRWRSIRVGTFETKTNLAILQSPKHSFFTNGGTWISGSNTASEQSQTFKSPVMLQWNPLLDKSSNIWSPEIARLHRKNGKAWSCNTTFWLLIICNSLIFGYFGIEEANRGHCSILRSCK